MPMILAMDAGGTSTRAVVLDAAGRCLGYGRAGTGNPTAVGFDLAIEQLALAAERASGTIRAPEPDSVAVISLAGSSSGHFVERLAERFAALGYGSVVIQPDLLGTYFSGSIEQEGTALIAGTGSVAGRISGGKLEFTRGGTGWLLGDDGSGFWIGRRVARAVVAAFDGLAPATVLSELVLKSFAIEAKPEPVSERPPALTDLMQQVYALPPVALARLAPLAFDARHDQVARGILEDAAEALGRLLSVTRGAGESNFVVLGGSILAAGMRLVPEIFEPRLAGAAAGAELIAVADGTVGAAVLGLRHSGVHVDEHLHAALRADIARLSAADAVHQP